MKKSTVLGLVVSGVSLCLTMLVLELAVRIHRGQVLHFESSTAEPQAGTGRMAYDPRLGWIPRPGRFGTDWISNVDAASVRSNGGSIPPASRPILAVGDSFTFGDEVGDSETWAARLEALLNRRVVNAGVGAYGIDQAFLRAERLLGTYDPDVVILSFISDDISRTEYSYYPYGRGWKPYFTYESGSLVLRNVPVPQGPPPGGAPRWQTLRRALGYSLLANSVLGRLAPQWWRNLATIERIHHDGEKVSVDLLARLDALTRDRGGQFVAVAFATNGRVGDNARLPSVVNGARERGITVLDLSTDTLNLKPSQLQGSFLPGGHYSAAMNRSVAERITAFLHQRGIRPDVRP
jgi:hypothetical protein